MHCHNQHTGLFLSLAFTNHNKNAHIQNIGDKLCCTLQNPEPPYLKVNWIFLSALANYCFQLLIVYPRLDLLQSELSLRYRLFICRLLCKIGNFSLRASYRCLESEGEHSACAPAHAPTHIPRKVRQLKNLAAQAQHLPCIHLGEEEGNEWNYFAKPRGPVLCSVELCSGDLGGALHLIQFSFSLLMGRIQPGGYQSG